jgi:hypothetical protein
MRSVPVAFNHHRPIPAQHETRKGDLQSCSGCKFFIYRINEFRVSLAEWYLPMDKPLTHELIGSSMKICLLSPVADGTIAYGRLYQNIGYRRTR